MLNVKTGCGAIGNYNPATGAGTDDTTAFNSAIAASQSTGQSLYVPASNYKITAPIGRSSWPINTGCQIYGDGKYTSHLYMIGTLSGAPGGGMLIISGQGSYLRDIGFVCKNNSQNLLEVGFSPATYSNEAEISSCGFSSYSVDDIYVNAVYCYGLKSSTFSKCLFQGLVSYTNTLSGYGIHFSGSVNNTVNQCNFESLDRALYVDNSTSPSGTQGILVSGSVIFVANNGMYIDSTSGSTAYVSIVNNIIDYVRAVGIYAIESPASFTSNYIGVDASLGTASSAIFLSGCSRVSVIGNSMYEYSGASAASVAGIALFSSSLCVLSSNTSVYFNNGIYVDSTCAHNIVSNNIGQLTYSNFIYDNSTSTIKTNNYPVP